MRTSLVYCAALTLWVFGSSALAESITSPSQLNTHSLFAEVEYASLQETTQKSFLFASSTSESISAAIWDANSFAAVLATTRGTAQNDLDEIRISFANNMAPLVMASTHVNFSLEETGRISLGELASGGPDFLGTHAIEIWGNRSSQLLGTLNHMGQSVNLESQRTYELRLALAGNTDSSGSWGTWTFDIDYEQSVPVPGPAGLAFLAAAGLLRRRRR